MERGRREPSQAPAFPESNEHNRATFARFPLCCYCFPSSSSAKAPTPYIFRMASIIPAE
jgi:hypothetical protein